MQEVEAKAVTPKPPLGIVFDSDIGNRPDSLLALALLYGFDARNEVRTVLVTTSKPNLKSAALCDAIGKFYAAGGFSRILPVGMPETGKGSEDTPILSVAEKYPNSIRNLTDTAEVNAVLRNAFTAHHDGNCAVVLAGPPTNLASVLALAGAKDWISRKVRVLVIADHLSDDIPAAKTVLSDWPGPVVFVPSAIGKEVTFPYTAFEQNFSWTDKHPIVDACKAAAPGPYDLPTLDLAAVLYAVRPQEGYFRVSEPGTLTVLDDGATRFATSPAGKHRILMSDPSQKERLLKIYTEVASVKPVPRVRPRPPVAKPEEKQQEKKTP